MKTEGNEGFLTVTAACHRMGVSYNGFLKWEGQRLAPRRVVVGHRFKVPVAELVLWEAQRERDRLATGKSYLRRPLEPLSWTPEAVGQRLAEAFQEQAEGMAQ